MSVMIIKSAARLLRTYTSWVRQLPKATEFMFAARSRAGRSVKIFLFGIGVFLPLGSLIWALLFWHGNAIGRVRSTVLPGKALPIISATGNDA